MISVVAALDHEEVPHLRALPLRDRGAVRVGVLVEVQLDHPEGEVVRVHRADREREVVRALPLALEHGLRRYDPVEPARRPRVEVPAAEEAEVAARVVRVHDVEHGIGEARGAARVERELRVGRLARSGRRRGERSGEREERVVHGGVGRARRQRVVQQRRLRQRRHVGVVGLVDAEDERSVPLGGPGSTPKPLSTANAAGCRRRCRRRRRSPRGRRGTASRCCRRPACGRGRGRSRPSSGRRRSGARRARARACRG